LNNIYINDSTFLLIASDQKGKCIFHDLMTSRYRHMNHVNSSSSLVRACDR